ncbi:STAS domain-containing protein [Orenia metallireducens]
MDKIIFLMEELEYMSIRGIRTIFFAKEKVAVSSDVVLVGAQNKMLDPLKLSELDNFFVIKESEEQYN